MRVSLPGTGKARVQRLLGSESSGAQRPRRLLGPEGSGPFQSRIRKASGLGRVLVLGLEWEGKGRAWRAPP
jgi:hypothetical protein